MWPTEKQHWTLLSPMHWLLMLLQGSSRQMWESRLAMCCAVWLCWVSGFSGQGGVGGGGVGGGESEEDEKPPPLPLERPDTSSYGLGYFSDFFLVRVTWVFQTKLSEPVFRLGLWNTYLFSDFQTTVVTSLSIFRPRWLKSHTLWEVRRWWGHIVNVQVIQGSTRFLHILSGSACSWLNVVYLTVHFTLYYIVLWIRNGWCQIKGKLDKMLGCCD